MSDKDNTDNTENVGQLLLPKIIVLGSYTITNILALQGHDIGYTMHVLYEKEYMCIN